MYVTTNHTLHFTVQLPFTQLPYASPPPAGFNRSDYFCAAIPSAAVVPSGLSPLATFGNYLGRYQDSPNTFTSPWAEVAYFLAPTNTDFADGTTPLYSLYRHQHFGRYGQHRQPDATLGPQCRPAHLSEQFSRNRPQPEFSDGYDSWCQFRQSNSNQRLNGPQDVTIPQYRLGAGGATSSNFQTSIAASALLNDLILTDVISFNVRLLVANCPTNDFVDLFYLAGTDPNNPNPNPFTPIASPLVPNGLVFDTWSSSTDPQYGIFNYSTWNTGPANQIPIFKDLAGNPIRILAIQVTIRAWDEKTSQTRQISIIQNLSTQAGKTPIII